MEPSSSIFEKRNEEKIMDAPPIPERISDKLYNSIVRINFIINEEKYIGSGFFVKCNVKIKKMNFIMTCYHVIKEKFVDEKNVITLYYGKYNEEESFKIKLDRNKRYIKCFDKPIDATLIEIIEEDNVKE